jgi:hypothetical protein
MIKRYITYTYIDLHVYTAVYDHAHDTSLYKLCYAVVSTAVLCALYSRINKVALAMKIACCIANKRSTGGLSIHYASTYRLLQAKQHHSSLATSTCTAGTMLQYHFKHQHNKNITAQSNADAQHGNAHVLHCSISTVCVGCLLLCNDC